MHLYEFCIGLIFLIVLSRTHISYHIHHIFLHLHCICIQVRHEAAEALGAIGADELTQVLQSYVKDKDAMIRLVEIPQVFAICECVLVHR
jgi:hypothetical protein